MKRTLLFLSLLSLIGCERSESPAPTYPFPTLPAVYEKISSIDVQFSGNYCPGGGGTFTFSGHYGINVEKRTYSRSNDLCKFLSSKEVMDLLYSTDKNAAVTPIRDMTVYEQAPDFRCEGVHFVYPASPIWLNQKGWSCSAFKVEVTDPLGRTVGGVDDNCKLTMTSDSPRGLNLTITVTAKNSGTTKTIHGGCF